MACVAFLVGFVFIGEIAKSEWSDLMASSILALAAATYAFGIFLWGREGGLAGRLLREFLALGGAFVLLLIHSPAAEYMARPLLVRPEVDRADAIVVLGGGLYPNGALRPPSLERTLYGAELYHRRMAPWLLLSGGITGGAPRAEAEAMADLARGAGVPAAAVLVEQLSRTTYENAVETAKVLRGRGFRRALLVTDPTHMYRSQLAFQRQGVQILPAPTRTGEALVYTPGGRAALFYAALHEYGGLAYYKARGRI